MSLSTESNRVVATGDGATTVFSFNRLLYDATHLQVYVGGVLQSSGYTVSGVPGTSTFVTFSAAPAASAQVLLLRVVPLTQLSVYDVAGAFPAKTTEKNFDMAFMALQQFDEINDRAVTLPVTSTLTATDIPDPALPANYNRGIKIKGDGTGLDTFVVSGAASGIVTTKGDLHIYGAGAEDRMPVGANGSFLIGASGETRGLKYFTPGTDGYVLQSNAAQTDKLIWVAPHQPANPIINGNMEVWQRGTTFTGVTTGTVWFVDRFVWSALLHAATVTLNRSTNVPTVAQAGVLFNYSLEVDVTTADASMDAGDMARIFHRIEGYNWRHFAQREITISFWVSATKTGTYSLHLENAAAAGANARGYIATYTINQADTWEYKTITIPASPSAGGWDYTNGIGVIIAWMIMAGSTYHGTVGSWYTPSAVIQAASSQVNGLDSAANFFRLTGVKMELGSVATPIQFVPFEEELARCMRYYQKSFPYTTVPAQISTIAGLKFTATLAGAVNQGSPSFNFPVLMRVAPTITTYNPAAANAQVRNLNDSTDHSSTTVFAAWEGGFALNHVGAAGTAVGELLGINYSADAEL